MTSSLFFIVSLRYGCYCCLVLNNEKVLSKMAIWLLNNVLLSYGIFQLNFNWMNKKKNHLINKKLLANVVSSGWEFTKVLKENL